MLTYATHPQEIVGKKTLGKFPTEKNPVKKTRLKKPRNFSYTCAWVCAGLVYGSARHPTGRPHPLFLGGGSRLPFWQTAKMTCQNDSAKTACQNGRPIHPN